MWGPYLADHERVPEWSKETLKILRGLAEDDDSGVTVREGVEATRIEMDPPAWIADLEYSECPPTELPDGFVRGWQYAIPVADMPVYLKYLEDRLKQAGGRLEQGVVTSLETVTPVDASVVNCTGLGAGELAQDADVVPVRGQLVEVENPGIKKFFGEYCQEGAEPTYFLPHGNRVVLGGTHERGRTDIETDAESVAGIIQRCVAVEPALQNAKILNYRVGIRPSRPKVRVERVRLGSRHVVHNYGHGGSGFSLSWGCAREVVNLVLDIQQPPDREGDVLPYPPADTQLGSPSRRMAAWISPPKS